MHLPGSISQVSEAHVHANQTTDHAPISIKVNGLRIVSGTWRDCV